MQTIAPFAAERFTTPAQQLITAAGVEENWPIPLEKIAEYLGYKCFGFDSKTAPTFEDVSGVINHEKKEIYINVDDSLGRQRFTLAHEIAHAYLHKNESIVDYRKNILTPTEAKEVEANKFAADLLMDALKFTRKWVEFKSDIKELSRYFGVSEDAAEVRIKYLRLDRA